MAHAAVLFLLCFLCDWVPMSESLALQLENSRVLDERYQQDRAEYTKKIRQLSYLLSVRANAYEKSVLLSTRVNIVNLGRAEAYTRGKTIYFDMALLDLLAQFADELSVAELKQDPIHQLQFNLAYAAALNHDKQLNLLDPFNTVNLTEDQKLYLWKAKVQAERIIFENVLGFILAHEFSHLLLKHHQRVQQEFPNESERSTANPYWNRQRRTMEVEADEWAARLCLNALVQPAQLIPWLDLTETRRRYYGKSAEYPTSAQRIAVIQQIYEKIVGIDAVDGDLRDFNPLPPDRDISQADYHLYFDEFRKVRQYRQALLVNIDRAVIDLLDGGQTLNDAVEVFIAYVEQQKDLLKGAADQEILGELKRAIEQRGSDSPEETTQIANLVKKAGIGPYAEAWLLSMLEVDQIDWPQITLQLELLEGDRNQFLLGLTYEYLLTNTALRWSPEIFRSCKPPSPIPTVKRNE